MWLARSAEVKKKLNQVLAEEIPWVEGPVGSYLKDGALRVLNLGIGQAVPWASRNGFKVIEMKKGYIKARIKLKGNKNHFGAMYAGAIFTVAEIPGGVLAILNFSDKFFPVLKEQKVDFLNVARSDITVSFRISKEEMDRIEKEAEELGRAEFILRGEVLDKDNTIVAHSYAVYQLRLRS